MQGIGVRHAPFYLLKATKRALESQDDAAEAKRGCAERSDEEEEKLVEEKLRQLQQLAQSPSTQQSPADPAATVCLNSHWQQIGNLMLYTAAGVTGSPKVRLNGGLVKRLSKVFNFEASVSFI